MNDKALSKQRGQSIVLVAVAMVALVLFVAITVDIGYAYQQRRQAQNAADGGALAGVSQMATGINNLKKQDGLIQTAMNDFAERNGIADTDGTLANTVNDNVDGWYVDMEGNRLPGEPMVGAGTVPDGAYGVEAITHIVAPTFFGGIFGLHGLPLQARAVSLLRQACGEDCVVPITTDASFLFDEEGEPRVGDCFNIWRESQTVPATPGAYGWISWVWQQQMCDPIIGDGRPCPNIDQKVNGCDAVTLPTNLDPNNCASGFIKVGDWVSAATGTMNADDVRRWLCYYLGENDPACAADGYAVPDPHPFTIPVYDTHTGILYNEYTPCLTMKDPYDPESGGLHYRVVGFARMQVLGFGLSQGEGVTYGINPDNCVTLGVGGEGERITAEFLEYVQDYDTSSECYDPLGTLLSAPRLNE